MRYRRPKWAPLRRLLIVLSCRWRARRRRVRLSAGDRRYLESMPAARLERDLGLIRIGRDYKPWL